MIYLSVQKILCSRSDSIHDNDYCTVPVHIPSGIFSLTPQEREAAFKMALNLQLESYFKTDSIPDTGNDQPEDEAFYGKPNEIIYIDEYVQLPTLEEYFNELPTIVKVRKRQNKKYFRILGTQTGLTEFDPLIMVDFVAIEDMSKILEIAPSSLSRIEVVNTLYVKGDQIYGGIINLVSRNSDFAGINLPSSGIFINYGFLATAVIFRNLHPTTPDTRNTLYWKPQLALNKNSSAKLSIMAPDTPGRYVVVLNGVNEKGETFRQTAVFEVLSQHE